MSTSRIPDMIKCGACSLRPAKSNNVWIVEELFKALYVRKYYVLRDNHAANIRSFCQYIIAAESTGKCNFKQLN